MHFYGEGTTWIEIPNELLEDIFERESLRN